MSFSRDELKQLVKSAIVEKEKDHGNSSVQSHIDHECGCPGCYCGTIKKMNDISDFACKDCGLPLGKKEFVEKIDSCPNCGGQDVIEFEKKVR